MISSLHTDMSIDMVAAGRKDRLTTSENNLSLAEPPPHGDWKWHAENQDLQQHDNAPLVVAGMQHAL